MNECMDNVHDHEKDARTVNGEFVKKYLEPALLAACDKLKAVEYGVVAASDDKEDVGSEVITVTYNDDSAIMIDVSGCSPLSIMRIVMIRL